jgi:hypothetical protein
VVAKIIKHNGVFLRFLNSFTPAKNIITATAHEIPLNAFFTN